MAQNFLDETQTLIAPFLRDRGIRVLGVIPKDPLMGAIKVSDLADRLGGKIISAQHKAGRIVAGEDCRTNLPGVYAAGDVRVKPIRQLTTAAADGTVAALLAEKYLEKLKEQ